MSVVWREATRRFVEVLLEDVVCLAHFPCNPSSAFVLTPAFEFAQHLQSDRTRLLNSGFLNGEEQSERHSKDAFTAGTDVRHQINGYPLTSIVKSSRIVECKVITH